MFMLAPRAIWGNRQWPANFLEFESRPADAWREARPETTMDLLRDPISSASHFLMAVAPIFVSLFLMRITRGDLARRTSVLTFAICFTILYLASGLYHAVRLP